MNNDSTIGMGSLMKVAFRTVIESNRPVEGELARRLFAEEFVVGEKVPRFFKIINHSKHPNNLNFIIAYIWCQRFIITVMVETNVCYAYYVIWLVFSSGDRYDVYNINSKHYKM